MIDNNIKLRTGKEKNSNNLKKSSKWQDMKASFQEFWKEFRLVKYGIVGIVFFIIFLLLIILEPWIITFPEASSRWRDITYWDDNPKNAAPVWTNYFSSKKKALHQIIKNPVLNTKDVSGMQMIDTSFNYNYNYDLPPMDIIFHASGKGNITFILSLERPDGKEIELTRKSIKSNNNKNIKLSLDNESIRAAYDFGKIYDTTENTKGINKDTIRPINVLFAQAKEGIFRNPEPLKGNYKLKLSALVMGKKGFLKDPYLVISGKVFGILGTDSSKRDLWSGVIAGTKWAMLIGLLTAFVSVIIGVLYGVTSAYYGGWVDSLMMRIYEIFISIPFLPIIIVMSAIFKPNIWILILMMCLFFWVGPVRTVRSIGLQIKEETYIEAAHALDASNTRIIFKHMIPQLIPYSFASMALRVPASIVTEASISLLGLGDATIVTWGQILHDAMHGSAVLQGLWWWVIPPGLFIALMGMTFAFIGFAMDTILNPKLKTR